MSEIQNKKNKNSFLRQKKNPKDESKDLDFSITKNIIKSDAHGSSLNGYEYKKRKMEQEIEENKKRESFWDTLNKADNQITDIGEKVLEQVTKKIRINKKEHKKSPYVVHLLKDEQTPSRQIEKTKIQESENSGAWIKEVERLRKGASSAYKKGVNSVYIDLLGKKEKVIQKKKRKLSFSSFPKILLECFISIIRATLRWIFEFVLSIPLGFLLAFQVLLKFVEFLNKWGIKGGRIVGKGVSFTIEQAIFLVIAIAKGFIVIPIKLITIFLLVIYRLLSIAGSSILYLGNATKEAFQNYFRVFIKPPKKFYKRFFSIIVISILIILPIKFLTEAPSAIRSLEGKVLGATKEGFASFSGIQDSIGQGQVDAAQEQLEFANKKFSEAQENIESLNIFVRAMISILPQGQDGMHAISAGKELTQSAQLIAKAISPFTSSEENEINALDLLSNIQSSLREALPNIQNAQYNLESINPNSLPDEYKDKFIKARDLLPAVSAAIIDFNDFSDSLLSILGSNGQKRYAVLFQNNNELRPSGGFIGSLAFVDVVNGKIENIEIPKGGAYDFQGYLTEQIIAPKPLQILNSRWEMQDANWYADWPTSAKKVSWFIEKSGHSSVDGVIAMQATTLVKLLEILGPIDFEEYGVVLDSNNVIDEMQYAVELDYDKEENQPKKYVAELVPRVLDKILSSKGSELIELLSLVKSEIKEKNILLYFRDDKINQQFIDRGWEPIILDSDIDYLSVIHANIGGGKTDGVIAQTYNQEITISEDGTAIAKLSIIRRHEGDKDNIFEKFNNVDYVRVYAPKGSELISFEGVKPPPSSMYEQPEDYYVKDYELESIEGKVIIDEKSGTRITQEFGKTVFGNWLQVDPQNTLFVKVKYKLPFKIRPFDIFSPDIKSGYSLVMQKQAGARAIPYSISLKYPSTWNVSWQKSINNGQVKVLGPGLTVFEGELIEDTGFALFFEEQ